MRYLVIAAVAVSLVVATSGTGQAGLFHMEKALICSDCHVMHGSQAHGYLPDGSDTFREIGPKAPYTYLLRDLGSAMCLECHDGQSFAPDVLGDNTGDGGRVRQAGRLNDATNGLPATGHTLYSHDTAPGSTFVSEEGLSCIDCHHQHGHVSSRALDVSGNPIDEEAGSYRNLRAMGDPAVAVSYIHTSDAQNDTSKDVLVRPNPDPYTIDDVDYNEPKPARSGMGEFCKGCHEDFHGTVGGDEIGGNIATGHFTRHPSAGVNIGAIGRGHSNSGVFSGHPYRLKVMSPTGDWGTQGTAWTDAPKDLTPTCISCHKAHGNQRAFGLIFLIGDSPPTENGSPGGELKNMCQQCHVQG